MNFFETMKYASKHTNNTFKAQSICDINLKGVAKFARITPISKDSYVIKVNSSSIITANRIAKHILAFNDLEIAYSEDLDNSELIRKSKKPLWALKDNGNGEFKLSRV